ncbi:endospore germination permease [Pseudalkalibacillus hwajinpoensis]|uniref:GerAB/ArcD/ProY family transporter n=1 Tax=Guptibacillus hwajinpoensis TaxID=208199 RepID=UPI00325AD80B
MEKLKISALQFTNIVILFTIGSSILIIPSGVAEEARQDGWLAGIVGLAGGILVILLFNALQKQHPNLTLSESCEVILGKWVGKGVSFIFISFFFMLASTVMWDLVNFLTTHILIHTPIEVISILFISLIIYATRLGLETIVRCGEIFLPWVIGLFLVLILFALPEAKFSNVLPFLEEGLKPVFRGAILSMSIPYLQLIVFLMLYPAVQSVPKSGKSLLIGTLLGGIVLISITTSCLLVLGIDSTIIQSHPSYILGKKIRLGNFIQRIEVIVAIIWMLTIFFKLVILFYSSTLGFAQLLGVKDYRTLTFPLGIILTVLSLVIFPNSTYANEFAGTVWIPYSFTICVLLPFLLVIIGKMRRKKADNT